MKQVRLLRFYRKELVIIKPRKIVDFTRPKKVKIFKPKIVSQKVMQEKAIVI